MFKNINCFFKFNFMLKNKVNNFINLTNKLKIISDKDFFF